MILPTSTYLLHGGADLSSLATASLVLGLDKDGKTRPYGATAWDIGAYEFGGDATAPTMSEADPSGSVTCTPSDPSTQILVVTTNENATCKWDTSEDTYDNLSNTFSTTGTTSHSDSESLACGASYTYYYQCVDGSSNKTVTAASASFTVDAAATPSPPSGLAVFGVGLSGCITFDSAGTGSWSN